jgi:hypothetical protein
MAKQKKQIKEKAIEVTLWEAAKPFFSQNLQQ